MEAVGELVDIALAEGKFPDDAEAKALVKKAEKYWREVGWDEGAGSLEQEFFVEHVKALMEERSEGPEDMTYDYIEDILSEYISAGREQLAQSAGFANSPYTNHAEFARDNAIDQLPQDLQDDFMEWFHEGLFDAYDDGYFEGARYQISVNEVMEAIGAGD